MRPQIIDKFGSIKEWKDYCFNTHVLYLKNPHFNKWIKEKNISIFNLSALLKKDEDCIRAGVEDAIRVAQLQFRIHLENDYTIRKAANPPNGIINSADILKMAFKRRKENKKDSAYIFIFCKPIKSPGALIQDGEALTYVSEGIIMLTFNASRKYPRSFLRRRAKHEALHMLGLNTHHEATKVKGYKHDASCVMEYNAPAINICAKCSDALQSFWEGIKYAAKN